ncbi:hypothetical protein MKX08_001975 [Trichoderma sp. CBMAI-0020]|nr:hypothetical protein MKX08_001975 [Trichoderma sp. CBMAI-0020]
MPRYLLRLLPFIHPPSPLDGNELIKALTPPADANCPALWHRVKMSHPGFTFDVSESTEGSPGGLFINQSAKHFLCL